MKKLFTAVLSVFMLVCLTACGGDKAKEEVGTYQFEKMDDGTNSFTYNDLKSLKMEDKYKLEFKEDGTGTLSTADGEEPFKWENGEIKADDGSGTIKYEYKDGVVTMKEDGATLTWKKK